MNEQDDDLLFADTVLIEPEGVAVPVTGAWKLAVIDDDRGVHDVSRLVLANLRYKGMPVHILHAYSGAEGRKLLEREKDIAVILLDVVMETDHAGLDLVKVIREDLGNPMVRIILRTGQPGQAPEGKVISEYDINDYKEKSELTAQRLVTAVTTALRGYDDLQRILALASSNERLESEVRERTAALSESNRTLQRNKALLEEAQRIASIGNYEWNLADGKMEWSDQVYQILRVSPQEVEPNLEALLERILVEDFSRVNAAFRTAMKTRQPYAIEHPIRRGDGSTGHVSQQGEVHYNASGEPVRLVGVMQDITERHQAGESMRKLSAAVEQTADAVMITNQEGVIEYVNPAFTRLSGYTSAEACGQTPRLLKSGRQPQIFYTRMWNQILRGEVFSDTLINRRKDGTLYHEARTITPQRDRAGQITHFISTGRDITDQIQAQERMQYLAHHDALTGLPNRVLLNDRIEQAIARSKWRSRHVAVLFLDMDRFKVINDSLGHVVGDELLKLMAERLNTCVREGDTVARLGGDEFAVVLNDVATRDDVTQAAQKILKAIEIPFGIDGRELFVTTSIGISMYPQDGDSWQVLLRRADVAMYNAKAAGKNVFHFYTDRDETLELARLGLETDLRRALERKEFYLVFQPLIEAATQRVIGMEALLRWRRQDGRIVPPSEFIGLLEETGLIQPVGQWVLLTACAQAQDMRRLGLGPLRVAVNISLYQFRQKGFVQQVRDVLGQTGLAPDQLELEITEGVLVDDVKEATQILEALNAAGVRLAIDDFGTGYSSMHYLRRLPFDVLKIDKSFIDGLPASRDSVAIVSAISTLARSMELDVVAEGVETSEQFEFVAGQGCHAIQGYYFSPPVAADEFVRLARQGRLQGRAR
jgi:diguanylate cyclase (GGDEF)-like protein/PAS domain S-box-containing protein